MKHPFLWCVGILAALGIAAGIYVTQEAQSVARSVSFVPTVPTRYKPEPVFFCNAAKRYGGLQNMVSTVGDPTPMNVQFEMLAFMASGSPDRATFVAMRDLYVNVLNHHASKATADVATIERMQPCVA